MPTNEKPRVMLRVDGEDVPAIPGEPVAMALWRAGKRVLARSVKYHRPRGAACFAGRCDGCLMRVDGRPSVRTCQVPCEEGLVVETQNTMGTARFDLLAAADLAFPDGMNHHAMFTWAKPANAIMQRIAREIAGVGTLPGEEQAPVPVQDLHVEVLIVGAGLAGLKMAERCAARGLKTWCIDEDEALGGWTRFEKPTEAHASIAAAREAGATLDVGHACVGIFDEADGQRIALVHTSTGALRCTFGSLILACGRIEGAAAFDGCDLPGVIGAEAAQRLHQRGIALGEHVVIAGDLDVRGKELARLATQLTRESPSKVHGPVALSEVLRARSSALFADEHGALSSVVLRGESERACDTLIVAPKTSAAYELARQAGGATAFVEGVFELNMEGAPSNVFAIGALVGEYEASDLEETVDAISLDLETTFANDPDLGLGPQVGTRSGVETSERSERRQSPDGGETRSEAERRGGRPAPLTKKGTP